MSGIYCDTVISSPCIDCAGLFGKSIRRLSEVNIHMVVMIMQFPLVNLALIGVDGSWF